MFLSVLAVMATMQAEPAKAVPTKSKDDEIVCEKQEVLGTRLAVKRVCKTRAEWAEERRQTRDTLNQAQMNNRSCVDC